MSNLYEERDIIEQGEHYTKHISAMTCEGLNSKSAIAAELAHRDIETERLRARVAELEEALKDVAPAIEQIVLYGRDAFDKGEAQFHLDMMSKSLGSGESKAFILRKQAEAVEEILDFGTHETIAGVGVSMEDVWDYAQRLRQQANELENKQ